MKHVNGIRADQNRLDEISQNELEHFVAIMDRRASVDALVRIG